MAKYAISDSTLTDIADAIRTKKGISGAIPVVEMKDEILSLLGDAYSTLPPPVGSVVATGADRMVEVSFETVPTEYEQYLGDVAYIVVLKAGSVPESPTDGTVIKMDKTGAVIG